MLLDLEKVLYSSIFILLSVLCWYYWKLVNTFRDFPQFRYDARWLFKLITGKYYRQDEPLLNIIFFEIIELCKSFQKDGLCLVWFFRPMLLVFNPEYVKILVNQNAAANKPSYYNILTDVAAGGLMDKNGPAWKERRKLLGRVFRSEVLKLQMPTINRNAEGFVKILSQFTNKPNLDLRPYIEKAVMKSVCECTFGVQIDDKEREEKFDEFKEKLIRTEEFTMHRFARPWFYKKKMQLLFEEGRLHQKHLKDIKNFIEYMLSATVNSSFLQDTDASEGIACCKKSLAHLLIETHLKDPSFTMQDLYDEVQTFLYAPHATTVLTMLWTFYQLGIHPEVQEKAFEEVQFVMNRNNGNITYNDFNDLKYLESVIKESQRLIPAAAMFARELDEEIECGKYRIPKKTLVLFLPYLMQKDPDNFPDPEKFDPERFYGNSLKDPWTYVPFAEGVRSCIGKNFALTHLKIYLAHFLQNYRITAKENARIKWEVFLAPMTTLHFEIIPRNPQLLPQE